MNKLKYEHVSGCLLGGAVGDALGAPVEFLSLSGIRAKYGSCGIQKYAPAYGRTGAITDDTQMTLFTLEGILRTHMQMHHKGIASHVDCVRYAYLRWLGTQGIMLEDDEFCYIYSGWLWQQRELHSRRAPGNACLSSLQAHLYRIEREEYGIPKEPINDSKGCGAVMRMAPVGLMDWEKCDADSFTLGCEFAALTHGHPSGYIAAGFLAQVISLIISGLELPDAISRARQVLGCWPDSGECCRAVDSAVNLAIAADAVPESVEKLGAGWVAEEALAISLFCALKASDFTHGVRLAVNHSGDSDSTGAITGNILGALWGRSAIPDEFLEDLELRNVIDELSLDWLECNFSERYWDKYPDG